MGGGTFSSSKAEEESSSDLDFPQSSSCSTFSLRDDLDIKGGDGGLIFADFDGLRPEKCVDSLNYAADRRRRAKAYKEVLQSYNRLLERIESLKEAKSKILSYTPGAWIEKAGGLKLSDYDVPKATSLVLIGPKGSGKSSLINRISRVIEDDQFASERAQVSYNSSSGEGTFFLHEYMIPRGSGSFCLYDTRGLSQNSSDNISTIKQWITRGIRHGELVIWKSDSSNMRKLLRQKACGYNHRFGEIRKVNYIIFVINGVDVLKSMEHDNTKETCCCTQMAATAFNCPYLSFKDDKPAVVITHGDLLSLAERARVRVHLGELLGIPPDRQIFDIPENGDPVNDLAVLDLLLYSLEHADKNLKLLPRRNWIIDKVRRLVASAFIRSLAILIIAAILSYVRVQHELRRHADKPELDLVDWRSIRHMWLDQD